MKQYYAVILVSSIFAMYASEEASEFINNVSNLLHRSSNDLSLQEQQVTLSEIENSLYKLEAIEKSNLSNTGEEVLNQIKSAIIFNNLARLYMEKAKTVLNNLNMLYESTERLQPLSLYTINNRLKILHAIKKRNRFEYILVKEQDEKCAADDHYAVECANKSQAGILYNKLTKIYTERSKQAYRESPEESNVNIVSLKGIENCLRVLEMIEGRKALFNTFSQESIDVQLNSLMASTLFNSFAQSYMTIVSKELGSVVKD